MRGAAFGDDRGVELRRGAAIGGAEQALEQSHDWSSSVQSGARPCLAAFCRILRRMARDAMRAGACFGLEISMPFPVRLAGCAALLVAMGGTACAPIKSHQGYVIDKELVDSVQPGVDNRESVMQTLGRPTLTSQFNQGEWYYVSRDS